MSVFLSDAFQQTQDFVFRTKRTNTPGPSESAKLSSAIEFYIEKFMSVMQLRCPTDADEKNPNVWQIPQRADPSHVPDFEDDGDDGEDDVDDDGASDGHNEVNGTWKA